MTGLPIPKLGASLLWKGGAILAIIATLVISGFLVKSTIENRQITKDKAALYKQINDPVTGYVARLTTARNNVVVLEGAIKRQNAEYTRQSNAAKAEMERLRKELRVAQAQRVVYEKRAKDLLAAQIKGTTLEERVNDVDRMILEDLRK